MAIIRAMQFDPVTENLLHVDLQEVSADKPITVRVAVHPVGEAVGVRDTKGILNLVLHEVTVSCLPTAIPERIDADVSASWPSATCSRSPICTAPEGVRILNDPGQAVATVSPPMAEEVVAPAAAAAVTAEPEVLTERKPKEGEEARGRRRQEGRSAPRRPRRTSNGPRPRGPRRWWGSATPARSTRTPATTWASACSTHLAARPSATRRGSATTATLVGPRAAGAASTVTLVKPLRLHERVRAPWSPGALRGTTPTPTT